MKYLVCLLLMYGVNCRSQALLADTVVTKHSLQQTLFYLSQDSLKGRLTGSAGADMAAAFIAAKLDSLGLQPLAGNPGFFDPFIARYQGKKIHAKNVVGAIPGKVSNDTVVIFSAHYDHIGQKDDLPYNKEYSRKDEIFNGANDNATGVAAMLELAKYYKLQDNNRYSLLFIAFSGEEMEMLGSSHFVEKQQASVIKYVINLEMLGRGTTGKCFIISFNNNNLVKLLNRDLKQYQLAGESNFFETDPYPDEDLSRRSDHYPFAQKKVKNAFTIMGTSPGDLYYHSVDDEYETIDFDFLLKATHKIARACEQFMR